MGAGNFVML